VATSSPRNLKTIGEGALIKYRGKKYRKRGNKMYRVKFFGGEELEGVIDDLFELWLVFEMLEHGFAEDNYYADELAAEATVSSDDVEMAVVAAEASTDVASSDLIPIAPEPTPIPERTPSYSAPEPSYSSYDSGGGGGGWSDSGGGGDCGGGD